MMTRSYFFVFLLGCCALGRCSGIKVLDNTTTKQIVNNKGDSVKAAKVGTNAHHGGPENNSMQSKPNLNGLTSTGPVVYPDNNKMENHSGYDKEKNDMKSDFKSQQSTSNDNIWVANNHSNSGYNQQTTLPSGISITSPDVVQIIGKDSRDSKNMKNFIPSPELKSPLTEEILHQNYMNDRTKLQLQRPQLQQQQQQQQKSRSQYRPNDSFQPSSASRDPYSSSAAIANDGVTPTSTVFSTNNQQESYQNQYQTQQSIQSSDNHLSKPDYQDKTKNNINAPPIYQKSGSTKTYYPSKAKSNENNGDISSSLDSYQPSSNQYVRNEIAWPEKVKDYNLRVQPQTVQEYVRPENWNNLNYNNNNNHETHQEQYQIQEELLHHPEHLHNHPNKHPYLPLNIVGPSNQAHHQQSYKIHEHFPSGLGQYNKPSSSVEHPYKFESVSEQDLKWEDGHHEIDVPHNIGKPFFFGLHHHSPPIHHIPKHYESEVITSNEDGTITVKGSNYGGGAGAGAGGGAYYEHDDHHHSIDEGGYHYDGIEHLHRGKASQYLYLKKIASVIAGIIPIGLLISALTPNYVVINPNATSLTSPVAPFTLVKGTANRQRSLTPKQYSQKGLVRLGSDHIAAATFNNDSHVSLIDDNDDDDATNAVKNESIKINFLKLRKKISTITPSLVAIIKNSKCIERSICELAAGNRNPQLLKSLLEELQRKYRNEIENSTITSHKVQTLSDSGESTVATSSAAATAPSSSSSSSEEEELLTSSSLFYKNNNKQQSFVSEDDLLKASKGVNCSSYVCEEF